MQENFGLKRFSFAYLTAPGGSLLGRAHRTVDANSNFVRSRERRPWQTVRDGRFGENFRVEGKCSSYRNA